MKLLWLSLALMLSIIVAVDAAKKRKVLIYAPFRVKTVKHTHTKYVIVQKKDDHEGHGGHGQGGKSHSEEVHDKEEEEHGHVGDSKKQGGEGKHMGDSKKHGGEEKHGHDDEGHSYHKEESHKDQGVHEDGWDHSSSGGGGDYDDSHDHSSSGGGGPHGGWWFVHSGGDNRRSDLGTSRGGRRWHQTGGGTHGYKKNAEGGVKLRDYDSGHKTWSKNYYEY